MAIHVKDMNARLAYTASEKLSDCLDNIMDVLDKAQKEIGK